MYEHDYKAYPELRNSELQILQFTSPHPQIVSDFEAKVEKVIDGDTIRISTTFRDFDFPLRILDIDAPEMSEGGGPARDWLTKKILNQRIKVLIDRTNRVDKYGRLLGKVLHNGMLISEQQIYLGLAKPYTQRDVGKLWNMKEVFSIKKWVAV
ncbi:MAG: thermonuclease family protein [Candidatus Peribacteraceae bacterium]|nr:thermonuclease family protein [Candidatus Peribacteraceae bacterium]